MPLFQTVIIVSASFRLSVRKVTENQVRELEELIDHHKGSMWEFQESLPAHLKEKSVLMGKVTSSSPEKMPEHRDMSDYSDNAVKLVPILGGDFYRLYANNGENVIVPSRHIEEHRETLLAEVSGLHLPTFEQLTDLVYNVTGFLGWDREGYSRMPEDQIKEMGERDARSVPTLTPEQVWDMGKEAAKELDRQEREAMDDVDHQYNVLEQGEKPLGNQTYRTAREYAALLAGEPNPVQETELPKPPLGILPKFLWKEKRQKELLEVMARYKSANHEIPEEFLDEYKQLAFEVAEDLLKFRGYE